MAREIYQRIDFFKDVDTDHLPYPIVQPLQEWLDELKIDYSTFFCAKLVANYEIFEFEKKGFDWIRDPSPSLQAAIADVKWPILRFSTPSKTFSIVPHLAIVGHEIGHVLFRKVQWDKAKIAPIFQAALQRIQTRFGKGQLRQEAISLANQIFAGWFEELCADAFGFYLTGPAQFFSLCEFSQFFGDSYGLSRTHPAWSMRRQSLFDALCVDAPNSFSEVFKTQTGVDLTQDLNSALLTILPGKDQIEKDMKGWNNHPAFIQEYSSIVSELPEAISAAVPMIYSETKSYLTHNSPALIYTPDRYRKDLATHLEPMLDAIPPIESGTSLDQMKSEAFTSIINVGWVTLLTKLGEIRMKAPDNDVFEAHRLESLHNLLLKAIELSVARRKWELAV